ncbi:MAG: hypothetical protein ABDI07_12320, partial [Candidatus Kryptonium sp.]
MPFQSLTGTIQTRRRGRENKKIAFVSIPHRYDSNMELLDNNLNIINGFNPSQVRFKRSEHHGRPSYILCFNPSQVRFKPISQITRCPAKWRFNPSQVRFKQFEGWRMRDNRTDVSIPHRYDS